MRSFVEIKEMISKYKKEIKEKYCVFIVNVFASNSGVEQNEMSDLDLLARFQRPIGLKFLSSGIISKNFSDVMLRLL